MTDATKRKDYETWLVTKYAPHQRYECRECAEAEIVALTSGRHVHHKRTPEEAMWRELFEWCDWPFTMARHERITRPIVTFYRMMGCW